MSSKTTLFTTFSSLFASVLLCSSCTNTVVTERDEMKEGLEPSSSAMPAEVPLRPEFIKAMQDREKKRQEFIKMAKQAPITFDEWKPLSSKTPDGFTITVPETSISLRVPKKWKSEFNEAPLSKYLFCKPPMRQDLTNPVLLVALIKPSAQQQMDAGQGLVETIKSMRPTRANWQQSKIEWGTIAGQKFARVYWSGDDVGKITYHTIGFIYATTIELAGRKSLIVLSAQDIDKYSNDTLPVIENEILRTKFNKGS
ncbi:MAG: hypothetical protein K2W95_03975 [Candidatus Obscuribacterales bacterium]|nr:hypothetical protein [Candidatus Obscuribacterales bacterium]